MKPDEHPAFGDNQIERARAKRGRQVVHVAPEEGCLANRLDGDGNRFVCDVDTGDEGAARDKPG
jgi:hypothetical protein